MFTQDGEQRGAFEFRTGLIPMLSSAAGKIYTACLPPGATFDLINQEWDAVFGGKPNAERLREEARRELKRKGYAAIMRADVSAYVSIAAPVFDWHGEVRFTLSLAGTRAIIQIELTSDLVKALPESAARATSALGGKASENI